ncbi:MAG TPA: DinB family protein [Chryseosolibacter sp.]
MDTMTKTASKTGSISTEILLNQWLGHRNVTRRVIEAFPEDKMFTYSIGGMRTFAQLMSELLTLGAPGIKGVVDRTWDSYTEVENSFKFTTKQELLNLWDKSTEEIKSLWKQIPAERFHEVDKYFGQWEGQIYWSILYGIDNEIHHRAQAYVYLRSLGIEPPAFWDRR